MAKDDLNDLDDGGCRCWNCEHYAPNNMSTFKYGHCPHYIGNLYYKSLAREKCGGSRLSRWEQASDEDRRRRLIELYG